MTDAPIEGWYPDPRSPTAQWRWWDGQQWTADTAPRADAPPVRAKDWGWDVPPERAATPAGKPAKAAREPKAPREPKQQKAAVEKGESGSTGASWVLAFAPWIYLALVGALFTAGTYALGNDVTMLPLIAGGAGVIALVPLVVIAELDGRALRARELPAPSSLLVIVLAGFLYFIVRARGLATAGARSRGPLITYVVVAVITLLAAGAVVLFFASLVAVFAPGSPAVG